MKDYIKPYCSVVYSDFIAKGGGNGNKPGQGSTDVSSCSIGITTSQATIGWSTNQNTIYLVTNEGEGAGNHFTFNPNSSYIYKFTCEGEWKKCGWDSNICEWCTEGSSCGVQYSKDGGKTWETQAVTPYSRD